MSLYPSLEDMKVDQMARAQLNAASKNLPYPVTYNPTMPQPYAEDGNKQVYPSLGEYMGLELNEEVIAANMPEYSKQLAVYGEVGVGVNSKMVAPVSGQSLGLMRAQVTNGIRQVSRCYVHWR